MTRKHFFILFTAVGFLVGGLSFWLLINLQTTNRLDNLVGSQWKLVSIDEKELIKDTYISLYFHNDHHIWGYSGCNTYGASYSQKSSKLSVVDGWATELGCSEIVNVQERLYRNILWNSISYSMDNNRLNISDTTGLHLLIFNRQREYAVNSTQLLCTSWKLISANGISVGDNQSTTLYFDTNGKFLKGLFRGYTGYYDFVCSYKVYGDDIIVTEETISKTSEIIPELRMDAGWYFPGMSLVANYNLTPGILELFTARGEVMIFKSYETSD
jgi:heat shock protein HslJ